MENLNFADSEVIDVKPAISTKKELLSKLEKYFTPESIEWLDSITHDVVLTSDEVDKVLRWDALYVIRSENKYIPQRDIHKPKLLFDKCFFPIYLNRQEFEFSCCSPRQIPSLSLLERLFRTDLLNDERIKSIPLLFEKIGTKEVFHPWVSEIIYIIRAHCAQNEEFAQAYQAKLAQIRSNNGSLQEKLALYVGVDERLIDELEQPALKILRELNNRRRFTNHSALDLLFVSLLQTPYGMQIPCWSEENYLCRLFLDCCIKQKEKNLFFGSDIVDKLFREHTTSDTLKIICNHLKWRKDNMPQCEEYSRDVIEAPPCDELEKNNIKLADHRRGYTEFLKAQLPELFSSGISYKYINLLFDHFFSDDDRMTDIIDDYVQTNAADFLWSYLNHKLTSYDDYVQANAADFLWGYLDEKLTSAVKETMYRFMPHISPEETNDWIKILKGWRKKSKWSKSRILSAMKIAEIGNL